MEYRYKTVITVAPPEQAPPRFYELACGTFFVYANTFDVSSIAVKLSSSKWMRLAPTTEVDRDYFPDDYKITRVFTKLELS